MIAQESSFISKPSKEEHKGLIIGLVVGFLIGTAVVVVLAIIAIKFLRKGKDQNTKRATEYVEGFEIAMTKKSSLIGLKSSSASIRVSSGES